MFFKVMITLVLLGALELVVIIRVGSRIGALATLASLLILSLAGAALARREGALVLRRAAAESQAGRVPGDSLLDGAIILAAGLLLLFPGYLTDAAGLLLLLPPLRRVVRAYIRRRLGKAIISRAVYTYPPTGQPPRGAPDEEPEQRRRELED